MALVHKNNLETCNVEKIQKNNLLKKYRNVSNRSNSDLIEKISDEFIIDACRTSNIDIIKIYLNSGHEINKSLIRGWSLMLYAAFYVQPTVIWYLLCLGGDPNFHQDGYTPLMALCNSIQGSEYKRMECLKYLIKGKVNINTVNKFKETAFMYACKIQEKDFILELIKHIHNINFADSEQRTALFYAVTNNRYDITKILIENGADINWTNYEGLKTYDIALTKRYDKLVPLLVNHSEHIEEIIRTNHVSSWIDMFPSIQKINKMYVDSNVMNLLYGMGLENYAASFCGIDFYIFLILKEKDLEQLGIDISIHRKRFNKKLFKFYKQRWKNNLLKINKSESLTAIEVLTILGNIHKDLIVIASSIYFSINCLDFITNNNESYLDCTNKAKLKIEIKKMQILSLRIKKTTDQINNLTEEINKENSNLSLPIFIEKEIKKSNYTWFIIATFSIVGIYFFRIQNTSTLSNNIQLFLKN